MFSYTEMNKTETQRMNYLGIPIYILAAFIANILLHYGWFVSLLIFTAILVLYSFLYSKAFVWVARRNEKKPGKMFYAGSVLSQCLLLGIVIICFAI
jgi:hypothetical protein